VPTGAAYLGSILIRGRSDGLVSVGEGRIRDRLRSHVGTLDQHTQQGRILAASVPLEYSTVFGEWLPYQRLELETDLIAPHTLAFGAPPAAPYIG
jgi:hypothetical protein